MQKLENMDEVPKPQDSNGHEPREYFGYAPVSPQDLPYEEDVDSILRVREERIVPDSARLRDHGRHSWLMVIFSIFFLSAFVVLAIWQYLITTCRVKRLCNVTDASSLPSTKYLFKTFEFLIPVDYLWAALLTGSLGLFTVCCVAYSVITMDVGTPRMVEIASFIQEGSTSFFAWELRISAAVATALFILVGVGINWRMAGSYGIGAILSVVVGLAAVSMATRGNSRAAAAAAQAGARQAVDIALRTGSVLSVSIVSIGTVGISAAYLMFQDIRSLAGFAAGASTIALVLRLGGGIYAKSADAGADLFGKVESSIRNDDPRNPATVADNVGDAVGSVVGTVVDLFESFVFSVVATAILGASLPFFYKDPFAICVTNHLYVDRICGPFGYPAALSHSQYICRTNNLYLSYPLLSIWQSNAAFVAVPFLLAIVAILASILTTSFMYINGDRPAKIKGTKQDAYGMLRSLRIYTFVSTALIAAGAAGICFGLFGNGSSFRAAPGQGSRDNVIYFKLSSATNSCGPAFPSPSGSSPLPTPQGIFELGRYRPFAAVNKEFDPASQTAWRLYLCILIGLALGLIIRQLTETFMNHSKRDAQRLAAAAKHGVGFIAMQGLGIGMGSTFLPMAIVVAAILATYNLYGSYGTALASVALLTTLGVTAAAGVAGSILDTAGGIAEMARLPPAARALLSSLRAAANAAKAICRAYSTISAVFTAYALLLVLVQDSGQTASPRELLGGPRVISTRFLGDKHTSPLTSGFVVAAVLVGFMLPLLFSGLQLISVSRVAQKMIEEVWGQLRQYPGLLSSASVAQADHAKCLDIAGQSSIVELLLPGLSCILAPFIIGFGFGQQALIAMLLAAIGSGYALSMMMVHAGCGWEMAKLSIEDDVDQGRRDGASFEEQGKGGVGGGGGGGGRRIVGSVVAVPSSSFDEAGVGSVAHRSAKSVDAVGDSLKDTVGSSLTVLTKLMTSFGLVSVSLMQHDETRGWIGAILLAILAVAATALLTWSSRSGRQQQESKQHLSISSLSSPPSPTSAAVAKDGGEPGAEAAAAGAAATAAASSSSSSAAAVVVVAGHYSEELAPRKTVSPFYAGSAAAPATTTTTMSSSSSTGLLSFAPGSQLHEAMQHRVALGRGAWDVDPRTLPGMADIDTPQLPSKSSDIAAATAPATATGPPSTATGPPSTATGPPATPAAATSPSSASAASPRIIPATVVPPVDGNLD